MSWERTEYKEVAPCACGKGTVVRLTYTEDDDWNRIRSGIISEKIECENCRIQYHIEHINQNCSCPNWEIGVRTYLVPNSICFPVRIYEKHFHFNIDEKIVSTYSSDEIRTVIADMIKNKYSTRLELKSSLEIVLLYESHYNKRRLVPIIDMLKKIEWQYDTYEWTSEKMKAYRKEEKERIQTNEQKITKAIDQSILLDFRRNPNVET